MRKASGIVVGALVALLVGWGVLHVVIRPVHPGQDVPDKHVDATCWWCHFISESAEIEEL